MKNRKACRVEALKSHANRKPPERYADADELSMTSCQSPTANVEGALTRAGATFTLYASCSVAFPVVSDRSTQKTTRMTKDTKQRASQALHDSRIMEFNSELPPGTAHRKCKSSIALHEII